MILYLKIEPTDRSFGKFVNTLIYRLMNSTGNLSSFFKQAINDTLKKMKPSLKLKEFFLISMAILTILVLSGVSPVSGLLQETIQHIDSDSENVSTGILAEDLALTASLRPWRTDLWEKAGHYALESGDTDLAISSFKEAASRGTLTQQGYLAMGDAYLAVGNPYTAVQIWQAAIVIYSPDETLLSKIIAVQKEMEDPGLVDSLKLMLNLQQRNDASLSEIAKTNYDLGFLLAVENPAAASPYLLHAVELNPDNTSAGALAFTIQRALPYQNPTYLLVVVGRELAYQGRWDLAMKAFKKTTLIRPDYAEGWAFLGESVQHLEDDTGINPLEFLELALEIDPASLSANILTAAYWKRVGDSDQHYRYLKKAAEIDPHNPHILVDLGDALAVLGELEAGYDDHLEAIRITHNNPTYLRALVHYCIRYNYQLKEVALPTAREAIIEENANAPSLDTMGQVLFRLGDIHNAHRFYTRAIIRDPNYAPAYFHLGLVYNLLEQPEQAADAFARSIALAPETPIAYQAQFFLYGNQIP